MREGELSDLKEAIAAFKREETRPSDTGHQRLQVRRLSRLRPGEKQENGFLSDLFTAEGSAFRSGVAGRIGAHELRAVPVQPGLPIYTRIETPFLIWAFRNGGAANFLGDTHIEPLNSSARFQTMWRHVQIIGPTDQVVFYFMWQNDTGQDAVVNVESYLMLMGSCEIAAHDSWWPGIYWDGGNVGESYLSLDADLKLLEWWNQPATQPLRQPSQSREVFRERIDGRFKLWNFFSGKATIGYPTWPLAGAYYLRYDGFRIPEGAVVLFEVSLAMHYGGHNGHCAVNFEEPPGASLICPYVELEALQEPMVTSPV